jgi:NADH:ubiquinone oxidoreductase subunit H
MAVQSSFQLVSYDRSTILSLILVVAYNVALLVFSFLTKDYDCLILIIPQVMVFIAYVINKLTGK